MALTVFGRTAVALDDVRFIRIQTLENGDKNALIIFQDDAKYDFSGPDAEMVEKFLLGMSAPPSIPTDGRPAAGVAG